MIKKAEKILLWIILIIGLLNLLFGTIGLYLVGSQEKYLFQTADCKFVYKIIFYKDGKVEYLERAFNDFKNKPENIDKNYKLYRTFKKDPLNFLLWYQYLNRDLYVNYDYMPECNDLSNMLINNREMPYSKSVF